MNTVRELTSHLLRGQNENFGGYAHPQSGGLGSRGRVTWGIVIDPRTPAHLSQACTLWVKTKIYLGNRIGDHAFFERGRGFYATGFISQPRLGGIENCKGRARLWFPTTAPRLLIRSCNLFAALINRHRRLACAPLGCQKALANSPRPLRCDG